MEGKVVMCVTPRFAFGLLRLGFTLSQSGLRPFSRRAVLSTAAIGGAGHTTFVVSKVAAEAGATSSAPADGMMHIPAHNICIPTSVSAQTRA